jgi:hypothetical protein
MKTSELVLVDSDVASYIFRQDTRAAAYLPHLEGRVLGLAPVSVGELYRWAELHN